VDSALSEAREWIGGVSKLFELTVEVENPTVVQGERINVTAKLWNRTGGAVNFSSGSVFSYSICSNTRYISPMTAVPWIENWKVFDRWEFWGQGWPPSYTIFENNTYIQPVFGIPTYGLTSMSGGSTGYQDPGKYLMRTVVLFFLNPGQDDEQGFEIIFTSTIEITVLEK
jgi:hypothetical protein